LALLVMVLEHLREAPDLNSGGLLESLRGSPHQALVEEILLSPILLNPELWAGEFEGALRQVLRGNQRHYFGRLVGTEPARPGDIGAETRARLRRGPPTEK
jgi:DNA primase DnaG DnaB-binding